MLPIARQSYRHLRMAAENGTTLWKGRGELGGGGGGLSGGPEMIPEMGMNVGKWCVGKGGGGC